MKAWTVRLLLGVAVLAGSGCDPVDSWERSMQGMLDVMVPDQHRDFSRRYLGHVLAGDFEAAEAMVATDRYCIAWLDDVETIAAMTRAMSEAACSEEGAVLERGLQRIPDGAPAEVRTTNYRVHADGNGREILIEQEFVHEGVVVRAAMEYRQDAGSPKVTRLMLAMDDRTLHERLLGFAQAAFGGMLWWLVALQFAAYLAVPFIVFWIIRRQRRRQSEPEGSGRFRA